ncbi:hypothetical protein SAMN05421595_1273 [Austwickia chelonae]|uniref:Metalloprotease n=1 Tax=Austwickia chelonae NBRC 105200 TaxID=1184607 RepID=K6V5E5_9MICO|nr:neutral zinc metallopeptidase [Austwickia chelonae]GAB77438.1 hypothetical protein AUCHE_05_03490 [Austwickia chelonae NBRC 105200]SEW10433.1 hypothetical protein SAMN05421595_1273 [Austwickia chelonae]
MTFNDDAELDTSDITGGGEGTFGHTGAIIGGGGGILGLIALVVYTLMGGSGSQVLGSGGNGMDLSQLGAGGQYSQKIYDHCKTGADANKDDVCLVVGTVNSVQGYWKKKFPESTKNNTEWRLTKTNLYSGQTQSKCGMASNQVGPFYCPADRQVYIDASFFKLLSQRFGSDKGNFAKMYVVAHEYGHAAQDQLGVLGEAQKDPKGPASGGVKVELMADCFAGMWAKDASTTKDKNGKTLLKPLTQQDIQSALSAASAVGDDTIQQRTQGRVSPENFTHGSAEQRMRWFMAGYNSQNVATCNTLKASTL